MGKFKKLMAALEVTAAIGSLSLVGAYTVNQLVLTHELKGDTYKTVEQIETDAELFGAPQFNAHDILRLKHNENAPIYVYISEEVASSDVELIKKSLNYFEDVFKNINDKYYFEIVDEAKYNSAQLLGDTTIKYEMFNLLSSSGENRSSTFLFSKTFIKSSVIKIDNSLTDDAQIRYFVLLHELAHSFGFHDVYFSGADKTTNTYYGNTIMQGSPLQWNLGVLTPEDYKMLQAMYNVTHLQKDVDASVALDAILNNIKGYDNAFYKYVVETISAEMNKSPSMSFQQIVESELERLDFVLTNHMNVQTVTTKFDYKLMFNDGKYVWESYENDELVYTRTGDYLEQDGVIIIPSLSIPKPSFKYEYNQSDAKDAVIMVAIIKQDDNHYLVPLDTLDMLNLRTTEKSAETSENQAVDENETILFKSGEVSFVLPKDLISIKDSSKEGKCF